MVKETEKKIFENYEINEIKKEANEIIKKWHKIKPDYVFLSESAAVPFGYLFKEIWKKAYPSEKPPIFYRMDPVGTVNLSEKDLAQNMKKRIKKLNPRILVFDEGDGYSKSKFWRFFKKSSKEQYDSGPEEKPKEGPPHMSTKVSMAREISFYLQKAKGDGEIYISEEFIKPVYDKQFLSELKGRGEELEVKSRRPTSKFFTSAARSYTEDELYQANDEGKKISKKLWVYAS